MALVGVVVAQCTAHDDLMRNVTDQRVAYLLCRHASYVNKKSRCQVVVVDCAQNGNVGLVAMLVDAVAVVIDSAPAVLAVIDIVVDIDGIAALGLDVGHHIVLYPRIGKIERLAVALLLRHVNRQIRGDVRPKRACHLELLIKQRSPKAVLPRTGEIGAGDVHRVSALVNVRTDNIEQHRIGVYGRLVGKDALRRDQQVRHEQLVVEHVAARLKLLGALSVELHLMPPVFICGGHLEHVDPLHVIAHDPLAHGKRLQMLVLQRRAMRAKQFLGFKVHEGLLRDDDHPRVGVNGAVNCLLDVVGGLTGDGRAICLVLIGQCQ